MRKTKGTVDESRYGFARRVFSITIGVFLMGGLAGCGRGSLTLNSKEANIPACTDQGAVHVEDIGKHKRYDCDFAGVTILFPDGVQQTEPAIGSLSVYQEHTHAGDGPSYKLANLGVYGVVASRAAPNGGRTDWWGTPDSLAKTWSAYGKKGTY
jgi:hypothetical protein